MVGKEIEVGKCTVCDETQLISVSEEGTTTAVLPTSGCECGSTSFRRLSVDEALSQIEEKHG